MARVSDSELMQEMLTWIRQNQYVYLATVDKNQPRVRPIVMFEYDERYFFTTYSGDAKVGQISSNKRVEVCAHQRRRPKWLYPPDRKRKDRHKQRPAPKPLSIATSSINTIPAGTIRITP